MKRIYALFFMATTFSATANPMFSDSTRNSVGIYLAQGTGQGDLGHLVFPWDWRVGPMTMLMAKYSQPTSFLRLPARINIDILQNVAYNSADGTSFAALGVSWDVVLFEMCGWYAGVGIGPYMRDSGDKYVASRLVFGERVFIGKDIGSRMRAELFSQHFSNGDFTDVNRGFNFLGLGVNYSF